MINDRRDIDAIRRCRAAGGPGNGVLEKKKPIVYISLLRRRGQICRITNSNKGVWR